MNTNHSPPAVQSSASPVWLDCTLRDGGYQNNWEFPDFAITRYLDAMRAAKADRVEIGLRSLSRVGYRGPTAFTSDDFLQSIGLSDDLRVGVMVNVSELGSEAGELRSRLAKMFPKDSSAQLSFVRLAAHPSEFGSALIAADWIAGAGFEVTVNLMQVSEISNEYLLTCVRQIQGSQVDVLYLADSLGKLRPHETVETVSRVREVWKGDVGFHAHDNLGLALANSLAALDSGASWIDSTVYGMGRGAGNTRSEILLGHLTRPVVAVDTEEIQNLIDDYFEPLRRKSPWGPSIHYVAGATQGVHPTYVQELTEDASYTHAEKTAAIQMLGRTSSTKYSPETLDRALTWVPDFSSPKSDWDQTELFNDKFVLLLGGGKSVSENATALKGFIERHRPVTIATNLSPIIDEGLIDAHVACHPLRLIRDAPHYARMGSPLIAPSGLVPETERNSLLGSGLFRDVGIEQTTSEVGAEAGLVALPSPQVLAYSLLVCLSGGARTVYLAGFDGYEKDDFRRHREQKLTTAIANCNFDGDIVALTPTPLGVSQSSVHGMLS